MKMANRLPQKPHQNEKYDHTKLERKRKVLRILLKYLGFTLLAKINQVQGMENIPSEGAAIIIFNHIAFIDPMVIVNASPRNIVPMAKIEVYQVPFFGIFPKLWEVIPVRRDEVDRRALKQTFDVLDAGEIVLIAPEGTRSPQLIQAKEGFAYIASRRNVPIIPVAIEGTEGFPAIRYSSPWRGPGASATFGPAFKYRPQYLRARSEHLRKMTDEAMYILASMLPPKMRGFYADLSQATQNTIEWI